MNAQVGHADIIGVRVDEGDGEPTSPVFDDGASFPGEALFGLRGLIPAHKSIV